MTQKAVNNAKVLYRLNVLRSDVEQAHKIFKKVPFLLETLTNPVVSEEVKEAVLDKIVRQCELPDLLGNFMKMMCRIGEIGQITDIFNCYYKYWDERNHILHAEVIYADEETKKEKASILEAVRKHLSEMKKSFFQKRQMLPFLAAMSFMLAMKSTTTVMKENSDG